MTCCCHSLPADGGVCERRMNWRGEEGKETESTNAQASGWLASIGQRRGGCCAIKVLAQWGCKLGCCRCCTARTQACDCVWCSRCGVAGGTRPVHLPVAWRPAAAARMLQGLICVCTWFTEPQLQLNMRRQLLWCEEDSRGVVCVAAAT